MGEERHRALTELITLSESRGYLTFDEILDCADRHSLPIQDVDWLSGSVVSRGIIVYETAPTSDIDEDSEEYDDFAHTDYEETFQRVIELDPSLEQFIDGVRGILPPQYGEKSRLKHQMAEGNKHARQRMIEMHIRLAVRIALLRAEAFDLEIGPTIGDACVGLVTAADKYDPDEHGNFTSYSSMWILQNIQREQTTDRPLIYYSMQRKERYYLVRLELKKQGLLDTDYLKSAQACEWVEKTFGFSEKHAKEALLACIPLESLETILEDASTNVFEKHENETPEVLNAREYCQEEIEQPTFDLKANIDSVLSQLKPRERQVLEFRYGFTDGGEMTLEEVGNILGITRERVRQIESKAIEKLRQPIRSRLLIDFYE